MKNISVQFNVYKTDAPKPLERPMRVMLATSIRDIGADDGVGRHVEFAGQKHYMKGVAESLLDLTNDGAPLENTMQVVGVVTDDVQGRDFISDYSVTPNGQDNWILHHNYMYRGQNIHEMVENVPSMFRKRPVKFVEERKTLKTAFEKALIQKAIDLKADVILSDHLIVKLETVHHTIPTVNIHPAVTNESSPFMRRGLTPTADTLKDAKAHGQTQTGATLHFVNDNFDDGLILAETDNVVVGADWTPERLRYENYKNAKVAVVIKGLETLAQDYEGLTRAHFDSLKGNDVRLSAHNVTPEFI